MQVLSFILAPDTIPCPEESPQGCLSPNTQPGCTCSMSYGDLFQNTVACTGVAVRADSFLPHKTFHKNALMVATRHLIWFGLTTEAASWQRNTFTSSAATSEHASIGREVNNSKGD